MANFISTPPAAGTATALYASTYSTVVTGTLLAWLQQFFANNTNSVAYVIIYTETSTVPIDAATKLAIDAQYATYKDLGYFKFILHADVSAQIELAKQCYSDPLLSMFCMGVSDAQELVPSSTTSWSAQVLLAGYDAFSIYHANATYNAVIVDLGLALGTLNTTGTPVGNPLDMMATLSITPSGTTNGSLVLTNLTSVQKSTLAGINVGYWLTVGDGTGRSAVFSGKTLKGSVAAAVWFQNYIDYSAQVDTAVYITQLGGASFKNNTTYQAILAILKSTLYPFQNPLGRLTNLQITAPTFAKLPASSGSSITIPNAWVATWNDSVRNVTVQGTLVIGQ